MCRGGMSRQSEREREREGGREGERLASTRRDRSLIFRRKVLAHCLKVDGVTPRRKITSGAASINSLLSPQRPRATTPTRSRGVKETRLQLFLYPPSHCLRLLSSRISFFLTRLTTLPPSGSSGIPLSPATLLPRPPPTLFGTSGTQPLSSPVCHAILTNSEFMELRKTPCGIHLHSLKKVYTDVVYARLDTPTRWHFTRTRCCRNRLSLLLFLLPVSRREISLFARTVRLSRV